MYPHHHYERRNQITTPRLRLRPMCRDDAPRVVAWRNDPSTAPMFLSPPPTLEEHRRWFSGPRIGRVDYIIERRDHNRAIGVVNFKNIDEETKTAEAGKLIGHIESRGQGMAKEAFAAWMIYGFEGLDMARITVQTRADNAPNIHLNRRLGFVIEDRHRRRAADGTVRTFVCMHLDRQAIDDAAYYDTVVGPRPAT